MSFNYTDKLCYDALTSVFRDGEFSSRALTSVLDKSGNDAPFLTRLFYGVLEKNILLDYIIDKLADKSPKPPIRIVLKMGIYMMRFMKTPDYAVTNRMVELCKGIGKSGVTGFVNSALKRSLEVEVTERGVKGLAIELSAPLWLVKRLIGDYGEEKTRSILSCEPLFLTHIRRNSRAISESEFESRIGKDGVKTEYGYYVHSEAIRRFKPYEVTTQGAASCAAVNLYIENLNVTEGKLQALDVCAAPGGKSIYLSELRECDITACDFYSHRVHLIDDYAQRMKAHIKTEVRDATVHYDAYDNAFDLVICDAPCSGTGTIRSKPDLLINRKDSDVNDLVALQKRILLNVCNYVKPGGTLCYSTCSILKSENEYIIKNFLKDRPDFAVLPYEGKFARDGFAVILPDEYDADGFFVARLVRNKENYGH